MNNQPGEKLLKMWFDSYEEAVATEWETYAEEMDKWERDKDKWKLKKRLEKWENDKRIVR